MKFLKFKIYFCNIFRVIDLVGRWSWCTLQLCVDGCWYKSLYSWDYVCSSLKGTDSFITKPSFLLSIHLHIHSAFSWVFWYFHKHFISRKWLVWAVQRSKDWNELERLLCIVSDPQDKPYFNDCGHMKTEIALQDLKQRNFMN